MLKPYKETSGLLDDPAGNSLIERFQKGSLLILWVKSQSYGQEIPAIGESIGADIGDYEYEEIEGDPYLPYPFVKAPTDDLSNISQKLDEGIEAIREVGSVTEDNYEVLKDVRSGTEDNNEALNAVNDDTEAIKNNTEAITDLAEGQTEMINLLEQMAASLDTLAGEEED